MIGYRFSLHCISQFIWVEGAGDSHMKGAGKLVGDV